MKCVPTKYKCIGLVIFPWHKEWCVAGLLTNEDLSNQTTFWLQFTAAFHILMDSCNSKDKLCVIKLAKLWCFSPSPTNVDENQVITMHASYVHSFPHVYCTLLRLDFVWDQVCITKRKPKDHPGWNSLHKNI